MDKATSIYMGNMAYDEKDNLVEIWDTTKCITKEHLYDINKKTQPDNLFFDYPHIGGSEDLLPETANYLGLVFHLVQGLGVELIYDIMKSSVEKIWDIIPRTKKPDLYIVYLGERTILEFGFELTEEQKEKVIDAGIKVLLSKLSLNQK